MACFNWFLVCTCRCARACVYRCSHVGMWWPDIGVRCLLYCFLLFFCVCVYTHKHECVPWHVWKSGQLAGITLFPSTVQVEHLKLLSQICWPISFPTELDHSPYLILGPGATLTGIFPFWDYRHVQPPSSFYMGVWGGVWTQVLSARQPRYPLSYLFSPSLIALTHLWFC